MKSKTILSGNCFFDPEMKDTQNLSELDLQPETEWVQERNVCLIDH